jgi:hypothetical protein
MCPNPGFYQHLGYVWSINICNRLSLVRVYGIFLSNLNTTNIALIPKGEIERIMKDWKPIALCNMLYTVVPEVFANRLK